MMTMVSVRDGVGADLESAQGPQVGVVCGAWGGA